MVHAVFSKFFFRIISWSIASKAFFKPMKITSALRRPLSILTQQLSFVFKKAVRVVCRERKPDWQLFNKIIFIQIVVKLVIDNFFKNFGYGRDYRYIRPVVV